MKSVVLGLALGSILSLVSATASAAAPVDYQKVANTIVAKRANDAFRRGPERVTTLLTRGKNVSETPIRNGAETITQKRGFFRNVSTLTRLTTTEGADGSKTSIKTEAKTRITFWSRGVKTTEQTKIEARHANGTNERTYLTVKGDKKGVSAKAETNVIKTGGIPSNGYAQGHDRAATATISTKSPTVKVKELQTGPAPKQPGLLDLMDPAPPRYRSR